MNKSGNKNLNHQTWCKFVILFVTFNTDVATLLRTDF